MKMVKRIIASAKVIIAFIYTFTYCQSWGTRKVTKITKRRKMFFLLNKCLNIQIFSEIWYLRRWSRICEMFREAFVRE